MQTRGQRADGEAFLADVFFATYGTPVGARMAAVLVDASEHLREREEANLEQLLAGSRILVAAVSHEVRNVCGAIGVMYENLSRQGAFAGNTDFEALGSLVDTLEKIPSLGLKQNAGCRPSAGVDLNELLTDFRIVLAPSCEESGIQLEWSVPTNLPLVQADRSSLLQVLLNLTKNSQRALESVDAKKMTIAAISGTTGSAFESATMDRGSPNRARCFSRCKKERMRQALDCICPGLLCVPFEATCDTTRLAWDVRS
jgi:two-component system, LuxR family, sensor kinase FixL